MTEPRLEHPYSIADIARDKALVLASLSADEATRYEERDRLDEVVMALKRLAQPR